MLSGLDYLSQQPAAPQAPVSASPPSSMGLGALYNTAAAIQPDFDRTKLASVMGSADPRYFNLEDYLQYESEYDPNDPMIKWMENVRQGPVVTLQGSRGEKEQSQFRVSPGSAWRLYSDNQLIGEGSTPEEAYALIDQAKALSEQLGKKADIRLDRSITGSFDPYTYKGTTTYGGTVFRDEPDPAGLGGVLKTLLPMGLAALSGGLLGGPLAGALSTSKAVGTGLAAGLGSTAGNLAVGKPLGQSLISGGLSGLTAGLLTGTDLGGEIAKGLGLAKQGASGALSKAATKALEEGAINVIANRIPSELAQSIMVGAAGGLGSAAGSILQPPAPSAPPAPVPEAGLNIFANRIPASSAFPVSAGLSGIAPVAIEQALAQPPAPEPAPTSAEELLVQANRPLPPSFDPGSLLGGLTNLAPISPVEVPQFLPPIEALPPSTEEQIDVEASRAPPAVIGTPPLPTPPINTDGLTQAVPDLTPPPEAAASEEEPINVVINPQTPSNFDPGSLIAGLPLLAPLFPATVPPITPPQSPVSKALTTAGRVLGGLSLLGSLGGVRGTTSAGGAYGSRASLDPLFSAQLPAARGIFSPQSFAPRDMSGIDFTRYGYGPAQSFFENVPETPDQYRAALAASAPAPLTPQTPRPSMFTLRDISGASPAVNAVRRFAPGATDAQIQAYLDSPAGADFLAALSEAGMAEGFAEGGALSVNRGGSSTQGYAVNGPGTGRSDEIPALLSDGEYVIDAETVALLGDGSGAAGAEKLDKFRANVRKHKGRSLAKGQFSANAKAPEQYLSGGRV